MTLAMLGGEPVVTTPHPHNDLESFSLQDKRAIIDFLQSPGNRATYSGREGIVKDFEDELARYHGRRYCILTNSGTSALHSAYFGLGLGPEDDVIAPTYTYFATVTSMFSVGAAPVLADCEIDTGNIDAADAAERLTERTRAIVVTHQWGHPVEMNAILKLARTHDLRVIEDASLAFGATYHGDVVGSLGDVAALSLGASKILAGGLGGALLTDDDEVYERATLLGHPLLRSEEEVRSTMYREFVQTGFGHNYRMHVLAAAMSQARFHRLRELIRERHERLNLLSESLQGQDVLEPPVTRPYVHRGQWGGYTATYHSDRAHHVSIDTFAKALLAEGLEISPGSYHPLLHRTPTFQAKVQKASPYALHANLKHLYREGDFPQAEEHADTQIGFPTFLHEPKALIRQYADAVHKVVQGLPDLVRR